MSPVIHRQAKGFTHGYPGEKKTAAPPLVLFLDAGFVEVNLHGQRPGLLGRI